MLKFMLDNPSMRAATRSASLAWAARRLLII